MSWHLRLVSWRHCLGGLLLMAALAGLSGCADKAAPLPAERPTGVVKLATSEGGCASQRAACHAAGMAMPAEIAASLTVQPEASSPAPGSTGEPQPAATTPPAQATAAPEPAQSPEPAQAAEPTNNPDSREANENGEYVKVEWGKEVTFDEMLEMGKRGEIAEIEWYAMPNAIRLITADHQYFHVKNEKWGRSVKKEFDAIGIKTGKGGLPLNYYFCN